MVVSSGEEGANGTIRPSLNWMCVCVCERERENKKRYKQDLQANPGSLMLRGALFKAKFDRKLNSSNNEDKLRNRLQITRKTKLFVQLKRLR